MIATASLAAATGGDFARTLSPDEMKSAGLSKLSPEELSRLEVLVERYRSGEVPVAQKETGAQEAAVLPDKAAPKAKKPVPDWVGALITLQRSEKKGSKAEVMEARIAGEFDGWGGRTLFQLENGQQWTQVNQESYVHTSTLRSPQVRIFPASFGTYWMEVEGVNQRCRVRPVKLE